MSAHHGSSLGTNVAISERRVALPCGWLLVMLGGRKREEEKRTPRPGSRLFRSSRAIIVAILYVLACLNGGLKLNRNVGWVGRQSVGDIGRAE
jgi:hypothetical protein